MYQIGDWLLSLYVSLRVSLTPLSLWLIPVSDPSVLFCLL